MYIYIYTFCVRFGIGEARVLERRSNSRLTFLEEASFRIGICNAWPDGLVWKTIYQRIIGRILLFRRAPFHNQINRNIVERLGFPVSPLDQLHFALHQISPGGVVKSSFVHRHLIEKFITARSEGGTSLDKSFRANLPPFFASMIHPENPPTWVSFVAKSKRGASTLLAIAQVCAYANISADSVLLVASTSLGRNKEEWKRHILIVRDENRRFFIFKREEF